MREIKFRAWDKNKKEMIYSEDIHAFYFNYDNTINIDLGSGYESILLSEDIVIMQYTGLKDDTQWDELTEEEKKEWLSKRKKQEEWEGKEIYEGDLIKNGNDKILLIYWNHWECAFRQTTNIKNPGEYNENYTDLPMNYNRKKIIGNKWENPELLPEGHEK